MKSCRFRALTHSKPTLRSYVDSLSGYQKNEYTSLNEKADNVSRRLGREVFKNGVTRFDSELTRHQLQQRRPPPDQAEVYCWGR